MDFNFAFIIPALVAMTRGERQSFEFTLLTILEYLVRHEAVGPVSKYHIMNRVPGISTQRQDRVSLVLDLLVERGWVATEHTNDGRAVYGITELGKSEYNKWVTDFLSFVRMLRTGHDYSRRQS